MANYFNRKLFYFFICVLIIPSSLGNNDCSNKEETLLVTSPVKEQCFQEESNTEIVPSSTEHGETSVPTTHLDEIQSHQQILETEVKSTPSIQDVKDNSDQNSEDENYFGNKEEKISSDGTNFKENFKEKSLDQYKTETLNENSFEKIDEEASEVSTTPSYPTEFLPPKSSAKDSSSYDKQKIYKETSDISTTPSLVADTSYSDYLKDNNRNKNLLEEQNVYDSTAFVEDQQILKDTDGYLSDEINKNDEGIKASKLVSDYEPPFYDRWNKNNKRLVLYEATTELKAEIKNKNLDNNQFEDETFRKPTEKDDWKFDFGDLTETCTNCDLRILPIRAAAQKESFRDSSTSIPEVSIQFADVPRGNEFQVDKLGLSEGTFLFDYLGDFLSWLQPNDFPVELMRDALRNDISIVELITQSLQLEAGFVACLVVGVLLALAAPIAVFSHTCYRLRRRKGDDRNSDDTWSGNCRRRTLVFILQIFIFLLLLGVIGMIVTNQQVSDSILDSEKVLHTVLGDLDTFVGNAHLQMHFAVTKHLEQAVQAADSDLNNVEILLGQPIQVELSRETGVDVALDSLRNIAQDANKIAELVELVQLAAGLVSEAILLSREKLSDLRLQVDSFKRQCAPRDRPLCDTISINGLDIAMNVDFLRQDEKLKRVRQLGGPELRSAVESTRMLYKDISRQVDADTRSARQDIHRQLDQQRTRIDDSIRSLEIFFRGLRSKVINSQNSLNDISSDIPEMEFYRWVIGLGSAGLVLLVWVLLQSAISCGCCGSEKSAAPTLLLSVMLICLVSTALWIVALIVLLVGGHGQVFVCRPLYQDPDFPALSQLLDRPGLFPSSRNFLSTLAFNNDTMDVPLNKILRECQTDRAAYPTFQLKGIFNIDTMSESRQWDSFQDKLEKINIKLDHVKLLSPELYSQLDELLQGLSVNLTAHRIQLSEPVTGKDLNAFAAQLDSVGNQLKDLATVSRIETLASRTRRLIATHIDPLKEKKENLMYQLTALEVQLGPLHHQVEQSISHLKTIQFFINSQGNSIAEKKTKEYKNRITSYIDQYRLHLTDMVNNDIARCQPLWNLFHTTRLMLCKHIMDPLNGFWFSIVWCLVILLCATPICLKLVDYYRLRSHSNNSNMSGSPSENLMSNEQGKEWATPNGNADTGGGGGW